MGMTQRCDYGAYRWPAGARQRRHGLTDGRDPETIRGYQRAGELIRLVFCQGLQCDVGRAPQTTGRFTGLSLIVVYIRVFVWWIFLCHGVLCSNISDIF